MKIESEFISFYKVIWWGFPTWSNLALENELKGVDRLLGMSSLAPLDSHPSACLQGCLPGGPLSQLGSGTSPWLQRDFPGPTREEPHARSNTVSMSLSFHHLFPLSELYNLTSKIKVRLQTNSLYSLSDTIYCTWIQNSFSTSMFFLWKWPRWIALINLSKAHLIRV